MGPLLIGYALGQYSAQKKGISRNERKELKSADNLIDDIMGTAAEHASTDPNLSVIIIDTIKQHKRKELA